MAVPIPVLMSGGIVVGGGGVVMMVSGVVVGGGSGHAGVITVREDHLSKMHPVRVRGEGEF